MVRDGCEPLGREGSGKKEEREGEREKVGEGGDGRRRRGREREKKEEEEKEREVMQVVQFFMPSSMSPTLCGFIVCLIKRQGTFPFLLSLSLSL